ncbi:MAG: branched-chain amino acid transporter AzlD [Lentisphaerae bacterium]|nr:branched-chain amino acid transporter AzlD [Lentisphaerota bacterium]
MNSETLIIAGIVAVTALVTIALRAFPFLLFSGGKKCPEVITYIGKVLSPAAIAMLAAYCLLAVYRDQTFARGMWGIPEFAGTLTVVLLHWFKKNPLLSIISGTAVYMILVQHFC